MDEQLYPPPKTAYEAQPAGPTPLEDTPEDHEPESGDEADSHDEITDLAVRAQTGDTEALSVLIGTAQPLIVRYARSRLGYNNQFKDADDVAQEVLLAVLEILPRYIVQPNTRFMNLVFTIANNKIIDEHRRRRRNRSDPYDDLPEPHETVASVEDSVLRQLGGSVVRQLVQDLSENQRHVLFLRVVEGYDSATTGNMLGSSAIAVRVTQHRALTRLREALGGTSYRHIIETDTVTPDKDV